MEVKFVLFYTLFGRKYNGFKSSYKFFDNYDNMLNFIFLHHIEDNCIVFKIYEDYKKDLFEFYEL